MRRLIAKLPIKQLFKFGIIGTTAAIVNFSGVILLVELLNMRPLVANIFAFLLAFNCSYFGHYYWSFAGCADRHHKTAYKFFLIAATGFILNEGLYWFFLHIVNLYYILALFLVLLIVPLFTFLMSKFWVFT